MNRFATFLCLGLVISACGCGQSGPEVVPVQGVLVDGGNTVEGAMVEFSPMNGRPSAGMTDSEGRFHLRFTPDRMGALPGEHHVRITVGLAAYDAAVKPGEQVVNPPKLTTYESIAPVTVGTEKSDIRLELKEMKEIK